jgi:hypothetical protein
MVTSGEAPAPAGPFDREPASGLVFPLAHSATLRVVLAAAGRVPADVDDLPDHDQVARGWRGHLEAGARIVVGDPQVAEAVAAARCTLLIGHERDHHVPTAAAVGRALALWGHGMAAATALDGLVDRQRLDGAFGTRSDPSTTTAVLAAWAALARVAPETGPVELLAEPAARAAHRLGRRHRRGDRPPWFADAQLDAAEVLVRAGQGDAADLCRARAGLQHPAAEPVVEPLVAPELATVAGADAGAAAAFLVAVRTALVDDREPPVLALLRGLPETWLGQEVEVHRLPTRAGRLSYALRWHGSRPALLWELDGPAEDPAGRVERVLSAPRLDRSWSSRDRAGEALLGPVEPAGGLPAVVAPLPATSTPVDDVPDDGVSFN